MRKSLIARCGFLAGLIVPVMAAYAQDKATLEGREQASKALEDVRQNLVLSKEKMAGLIAQVDGLKKDQRTITAALVTAAAQERKAADNIAAGKEKLAILTSQKNDVQKNLNERRTEFAEVLAALERMGLKPPPALLVRPDDALASVRSSVLLGAVVPDMRKKTLALTQSLRELTAISASIRQQQTQLAGEIDKQAQEQQRLKLLLSEKAKLQKQSENDLVSQRAQNYELAEKAKSLQDLVNELDRLSRSRDSSGQSIPEGTIRLQAEVAFDSLKGRLLRPVSGTVLSRYGSESSAYSAGGQGETVETEPNAIVTSPADGVVAYAGSFRSYGQLVILDVGENYHVLLAGMGRMDVTPGQFVLSGEPIGSMGAQLIASATALDIGKSAPMLYIEFRKQGKPVDPSPWWVHGERERNANDS